MIPPKSKQQHQRYVEQVVGEVRRRVKGRLAKATRDFARAYFRHVPLSDMLPVDPADLAMAVISLWQFARVRPRSTVLLRVFNPTREESGWSSPHTVLELVNDDMPFLVDSVINELARQSIPVHLMVHPVVRVQRWKNGSVVRLLSDDTPRDVPGTRESFMHVEVAQQVSPEALQGVVTGLKRVLGDVRAAVVDWPKMRSRVATVLAELDAFPPPLPESELDESKEFLRWLDQGHFTFLGYREYRFRRRQKRLVPEIVPNSGLGILRRDERRHFDGLRDQGALPPDVQDFIQQPHLLLISKGPHRATVHRNVYLDMIGVKQFDDRGRVIGERLFLGLFTLAAYNRSPQLIPLLRRRVRETMERARLQTSSHDGKTLLHILETFPRDDLFQISDDALLEICIGILNGRERARTALFLWQDAFERFVSCLVFLRLDRHNTTLRQQIQQLLETAFGGRCRSFDTQIDQNSVLARIHFVIETEPGKIPRYDAEALEREVAEMARSWSDRLHDALVASQGEREATTLLARYETAFDGAYQQSCDTATAVVDLRYVEEALRRHAPALHLYRSDGQPLDEVQLRVYRPDQPVPLSDALPILENLGFRVIEERPFRVVPRDATAVWIHDFGLVHRARAAIDLERIGPALREALARVWFGHMEDDGFNRLVVNPGLTWRQVVVLRAYAKYLKQAQIPFSEAYMQDTLANNPELTRAIVNWFESEFDPHLASRSAEGTNSFRAEVDGRLESVASLDEDRIITAFVQAIGATLRTNYFQRGAQGHAKPYLSLKLDSHRLPFLPLPRPMVEIFVYSPQMEGVHLRFGKVARGGLRWSDRREDFRTEVLGLVKAQQVKNALIVPVGSKGGFVVKQPPADSSREAMLAVGTDCYRTLIRGLLDLTDNYRNGSPARPADVVCKDDEDPYLVVAADKGTAAFSDVANQVAAEYQFWLGDAFAAGGSAGYDHKSMGITARGAWESAKRHFRELGRDIQRDDFTVIGVGDMSGDVFGNAMLLSDHIRLLAAFNHLHIFVDPDPQPRESLEERRRLFTLPRSTWADYRPQVLSEGGAVYDRNAKSLSLAPAVRKRFDITKSKVTPHELIRAILKAHADLLFFGGIGTFVKARRESHAEVGDRANDMLRVNAEELRAKVVVEGANLGVTQLGRVEFALRGGLINTDSVDNSAGVDCSDHEVNIKILLGAVEHAGLLTRRQRDNLLRKMTDEVASLVLADNYLQTGSLSVTRFAGHRLTDRLANFMRNLERAGHLDRTLEHLPDDETLADRKASKQGFTRPELCILMAYAKIALYRELLDSRFPDEPTMVGELEQYFPGPLRKKYPTWIASHRLRREIIATVTTNAMVNRVGIAFAHEVMQKTGKPACDVARAYAITQAIFDMRDLWAEIDALDNRVSPSLQASMHYETGRLIERVALWFLRYGTQPLDIGGHTDQYGEGVHRISDVLHSVLTDSDREYVQGKLLPMVEQGAPEPLARRIANLRLLVSACDIVRIADEATTDVERAGRVYFAVGDHMQLGWLRRQAGNLPADTHWDNLATTAIVDDLYQYQFLLTRKMLRQADQLDDVPQLVAACCVEHQAAYAATSQLIQELRKEGTVDLAMLAVASRQLRSLVAD